MLPDEKGGLKEANLDFAYPRYAAAEAANAGRAFEILLSGASSISQQARFVRRDGATGGRRLKSSLPTPFPRRRPTNATISFAPDAPAFAQALHAAIKEGMSLIAV